MAAVLSTPATGAPISGLARALIQAGRFSPEQIAALRQKAVDDKVPFIDRLVGANGIDAAALAVFCSDTFGYPLINLAAIDASMLPANAIDAKLMQSHRVIALSKRGNKLSVAVSDPTDTAALDQIKFQSGSSVEPVIVAHDAL
ncbi:MAG TPA: type IV-A pilus assembly ATPase PilB, partial [Burkholderiaceae bacterium]